MTGLFIPIAMAVLLFAALEVTHRGHGRPRRSGLDTHGDRDLDRLKEELRAVAQRDPNAEVAPFMADRDAPRSPATDHRLVNRIAA